MSAGCYLLGTLDRQDLIIHNKPTEKQEPIPVILTREPLACSVIQSPNELRSTTLTQAA